MDSASRAVNRYKLLTEWRNDIVVHKPRGNSLSKVEERWQRRGCIGRGGFGTVWLEVKQDETNKTRAVKEVKKTASTNHILDYRRELLALVELSAPTYRDIFAEFYGWYEDKTFVYYAMEYFSLGDLDQYLSAGIHEDEACQITNQVLDGLAIMHENSFTHRDLKPQNIFVVRKQPWWIKVGDFGISKRVDDSTALYTTFFSTGYAAPELESRDQTGRDENFEYTNAVDLWSLGCVTYKMLTGEIPFSGHRGISSSDFCRGRAHFPVEALIAKCVSRSAIEFVQALVMPLPSDRLDVGEALVSSWIRAQNNPLGLNQLRDTSGSTHDISRESSEAFSIASCIEVYERDENQILEPLGATPVDQFLAAAATGDNDAIEILRNRRVDVNIESIDGRTPLHEAAAHGQNSTIKLLLQIPGIIKDARDNDRNTPMLVAAYAANFESVLILLQYGANPRVRNNSGNSALHEAAKYNKKALVRTLIQHGTPASLERASSRTTPLHCAARNGSFEAMKVLLEEFGAPPDLSDDTGSTALHYAARYNHIECVKLLIQQKASIELKETVKEQTPLHIAVDCNFKEIALVLLRHRADPNVQDRARWSLLHTAILNRQIEIGRHLVEFGADVNPRGGPNGRTPLQLALKYGSKDFIKMLSDGGALLHFVDEHQDRTWRNYLTLRLFLQCLHDTVETGDHLISEYKKMDQSSDFIELIHLLECFVKIIQAWSFDVSKLDLLNQRFFAYDMSFLTKLGLRCAKVLSGIKKALNEYLRRGAGSRTPKTKLLFGPWGKPWEKSASKSIQKLISSLHHMHWRLSKLSMVSAMTKDLFEGKAQSSWISSFS